jgi:hypothetical protein
MPFGAGPPNLRRSAVCAERIGVGLASLLRAFRIELPPNGPRTTVGLVTLQSDVALRFRLSPRAA